MADGCFILTSAVITMQEFIDFLPEAGAYYTPGLGFKGQMDRGENTIWIGIDNSVVDLIDEVELAAERALILQKLGALPQTGIVIEQYEYKTGDTLLLMKFVCVFGRRWPCVVQRPGVGDTDDTDSICTVAEIETEYRALKEFQ